jgi:hypothetical protein
MNALASTAYDYEQDIRPRLREMSRAISLDELRDFLGQFGAAKASELKPEQFADLMAESGKLIERKAEQAAESERIAAEMEAERQAEKERLAAEAAERATVAEAARAEQQRLEDERMRAAVAERAEKERLAKAERDRLAARRPASKRNGKRQNAPLKPRRPGSSRNGSSTNRPSRPASPTRRNSYARNRRPAASPDYRSA